MKTTTKFKRIKTAFLAVILSVGTILSAGCGAKTSDTKTPLDGTETSLAEPGSANGAKGRYIEKQMTTPGDMASLDNMTELADGSLAIIDKKNGILYTSSDGAKTWASNDIKAIKDLMASGKEGIELNVACVAKDGGIFIAYVDWGSETNPATEIVQKFIYTDAAGNLTQSEGHKRSAWWVSDGVFTDGGEVYTLEQGGKIYKVDLSTFEVQEAFEMKGTGNFRLYACGDGILGMDGENVYYYNSQTGQADISDAVLGEFTAKEMTIDLMSMAMDSNGENIYTASSSGIYSHVKGGGVMEELLSGGLANLGTPSTYAVAMTAKDDGSFFVAYNDGEIDAYVYDSDISSIPEQELNIYGLYDNTTVRQAVSNYRKENPDVFVQFEVGVSGEDSVTENDAIQALNTRLLAGEGPDVILLDGMPMESYTEKGMLEDLSGVLKELKKGSSYNENILEAYGSKDGIYAMPFRFFVPVMAGQEETLSKITDLYSFADTVKELGARDNNSVPILGTCNPKEVLQMLYVSSSPAFMTEGKPDDTGIKDFLTAAKDIYEADQKNLTEELRDGHQRVLDYMKKAGKNVETELLGLSSQMLYLPANYQLMAGGYIRGMDDLTDLTSTMNKTNTIKYQPLAGQAQEVFLPRGIVGIIAGSKEKENAKAFVNALLGKTVQEIDLKDGFPVNQDAYTSFCRNPDPNSMYSVSLSDADGNQVSLGRVWPTDDEISEFRDMIGTLKTPTETDAVIKDTILTCGEAALTGDKSIEESVNEIKQKISLYLAE